MRNDLGILIQPIEGGIREIVFHQLLKGGAQHGQCQQQNQCCGIKDSAKGGFQGIFHPFWRFSVIIAFLPHFSTGAQKVYNYRNKRPYAAHRNVLHNVTS